MLQSPLWSVPQRSRRPSSCWCKAPRRCAGTPLAVALWVLICVACAVERGALKHSECPVCSAKEYCSSRQEDGLHAHNTPCSLTPWRNEDSPRSSRSLAMRGKPAMWSHAEDVVAATSGTPSPTIQATSSAAVCKGMMMLCQLQVGKSLLIRCLIKHYTRQSLSEVRGPITIVAGKQRRLTFVECPQVRCLTPGSPCPCMNCQLLVHNHPPPSRKGHLRPVATDKSCKSSYASRKIHMHCLWC